MQDVNKLSKVKQKYSTIPRAASLDRTHEELNFSHTDSEKSITNDCTYGENVLFARPGLQRNIIKKLKRGQFRIESVLDLHGMRTFEAEEALSIFLDESLEFDYECILIIHGKGFRSEKRQSVLKPLTVNWLKNINEVKAFSSALPKHGGTGAVYVLLKRGKYK